LLHGGFFEPLIARTRQERESVSEGERERKRVKRETSVRGLRASDWPSAGVSTNNAAFVREVLRALVASGVVTVVPESMDDGATASENESDGERYRRREEGAAVQAAARAMDDTTRYTLTDHQLGWLSSPHTVAALHLPAAMIPALGGAVRLALGEEKVGRTYEDGGPGVAAAVAGFTARPARIAALMSHFPAGAKVVGDVGCGEGRFIVDGIAKLPGVTEIWGAEPSTTAAAVATRLTAADDRIRILAKTAASLPRDHFDVILMHDVVHDLPDPHSVLREVRGALKAKGGMLITYDPAIPVPTSPSLSSTLPSPGVAGGFGISLSFCLSSSCSLPGGMGGGIAMGERAIETVLRDEKGEAETVPRFRSVERIDSSEGIMFRCVM
jgi:SAM-dependent methyltransferase